MVQATDPQIIECELRLHSAGPSDGAEVPWHADAWAATAVGRPERFQALAEPSAGLWGGPLPPGADISAAVALDDPWWSVWLPGGRGRPVLADRVGRALAAGEAFTLPPAEAGGWTADAVFDGTIVTQ